MSLDDMALQAKLTGKAHVAAVQRTAEEELLSHRLGLLVSLLMHVERATGSKPCVASFLLASKGLLSAVKDLMRLEML